uniref:Photosystem I assembly protein Ycf4 n=1 Tax=Monomorphina aenigmatica TaxID=304863 RepID=L0BHX2_MONAE|nr:photosystem I assembly protein Ycf4 [Monomorphina aenigmatica]AFZ88828.1 photosystem I assembly protein Ycf4 [Monomorphina aenigmatica]
MINNLFDKLRKKESNLTINENLFKELIIEPNKEIKYLFNVVILLGATGFLIVGLSSYLMHNIIFFLDARKIIFFPQGITMLFYGTLGTILSINQFLILILKVGEGYNEFNKLNGTMKIVRKGFPGRNSDIDITYPLTDIEAIRVEIKMDVFNNKQNIFACIKGKNDLPIIQISSPVSIREIEEKASLLASFLKVPVKGL